MTPGSRLRVGNDAGWYLQLLLADGPLLLEVGDPDYHAEIEASLPGGLDAGFYTLSIEGLRAQDHERVARLVESGGAVTARLHLYWRDTAARLPGVPSHLAALTPIPGSPTPARGPGDAPLVAVLRLTRFSRRAGPRQYETVIEGVEEVYARLGGRLPQAFSEPTALQAAARAARELLGQEPRTYAPAAQPPQGALPPQPLLPGVTGLQALAALGERLEEATRRHGRGMYLIRDGELHIGPRPIPFTGREEPLDASTGLLDIQEDGTQRNEPTGSAGVLVAAGAVQTRRWLRLTLKGRPDLKPGDVVRVRLPSSGERPPAPAALPGAFETALAATSLSSAAGAGVRLYVSGVMHRLSRATGFSTVVSGVEAPAGAEWDVHERRPGAPLLERDPHPSAGEEVVAALRQLASAPWGTPSLDVAEVRASTSSGSQEPPAQTVELWRGLAPSDGLPHASRRLPVERQQPGRVEGVPYLTPFAWGKTGLVLPRYPGMRVLVGHRGGDAGEPLDLGAFWESGRGPDSQPGDFWLSLPAEVPAAQRMAIGEAEPAQEPTGAVTQDLIDADGHRVIEVGTLTVRIGRDGLQPAGTRPEPGDAPVVIEHTSGSRIIITQDGDILIDSQRHLTLKAVDTLTLDANSVKVKVATTMDVS